MVFTSAPKLNQLHRLNVSLFDLGVHTFPYFLLQLAGGEGREVKMVENGVLAGAVLEGFDYTDGESGIGHWWERWLVSVRVL